MATTKSDKPLRYKRNSSVLKKVWNYMRRNRTFRVGDVMAITGVTHNYLKTILWHLSRAGYIKIIKKAKPYSCTQYAMINYTGVKSPSIINGVVYDYNIDKVMIIKPHVAHISYSPIKLLGAMKYSSMTKQEIVGATDVGANTAKKLWSKFIAKEVMFSIRPVERKNTQKLFKIDIAKAKELKIKLEAGETL